MTRDREIELLRVMVAYRELRAAVLDFQAINATPEDKKAAMTVFVGHIRYPAVTEKEVSRLELRLREESRLT